MGELYRTLRAPQDRLRICGATLLLLGGFRTDELLNFSTDALQYEEGMDGRKKWFIPYRNLKSPSGSLDQFGKRWLSPLSAELAQDVWREILEITAPWRPFASVVDQYEDRIPLDHAFGNHEHIKVADVQRLLGVTTRNGWSQFRRRHEFNLEIERVPGAAVGDDARPDGSVRALRRAELERWLVRLREPMGTVSAEGKPQRIADTLLIAPRQFLQFRPGALVFPEPFGPKTMYTFLAGSSNVFARSRFSDEAGIPYALRPHSLRHFLNTVARKAGMTALQITVWMGRSDLFQTYSYLHDPEEYGEFNREQERRGVLVGVGIELRKKLPVMERELAIGERRVAQRAGDVVCTRNLDVAQCPHHFACHARCPWADYDISDSSMVPRWTSRQSEFQGGLDFLLSDQDRDNPVTQREIADLQGQILNLGGVLDKAAGFDHEFAGAR